MIGRFTLRTRLAWGYGLAVAAAVLVYAVVLHGFTKGSLEEQLDARVAEDAERIAASFEVGMDDSVSFKELEGPAHGHATGESPWAVITRTDGEVVLTWPAGHEVGRAGDHTRTQAVSIPGGTFQVTVGRSPQVIDGELADLRRLLLLCGLPIILLAWVLGRFLAARALAPVAAMTAAAERIGAAELHERLPVANPDDELGQLAGVFNELFARLAAAFDRLRRFTADAAHELRTPLAAIRSEGEVALQQDDAEGPHRDALASMLEEVDRLSRLVDDLLHLSRADAKQALPATSNVDLRAMARDVADHLEVLATERGQQIEVTGSSATTSAHAPSIRRVLIALVDNAIRHGDASGPIRIHVEQGAKGTEVVVANPGPSIPDADLPHLFERFYRGDRARTGPGTGLGLALARRTAELHGGTLEVGRDGGETVFTLRLPAPTRP